MFCCDFGAVLGAILVPFWCRWGGPGGGAACFPFLSGPGEVPGRPGADKVMHIEGRGAFRTLLTDRNRNIGNCSRPSKQ